MPTKRNGAGEQQPYVPQGYGDASGEYAEHKTGSNKHYASPDDVKRQLGWTPPKQPKESSTPKELSNKLNGVNKEPISKDIPEEMKSIDYTKKLVQNGVYDGMLNMHTEIASVSITRGSLTKDEIGEFNKQIEDMYKEYPDIQRFTSIKVNNAKSSYKGGYISTTGYSRYTYGLYINAGWLDKTITERTREENIEWYKSRIQAMEEGLVGGGYAETEIARVKDKISLYKKSIADIENIQKNNSSNVVYKAKNRRERLKVVLTHELAHRVTQSFDNYDSGKIFDNNAQERYAAVKSKIREAYKTAISNGDAKNISTYATTNKDEFISEASAQMALGIDTPQYIVDAINEMREFVRSGK